MEGEHQKYREELAQQIKQAPREKRREILDQAKSKEEYWQAKTERVKGFQEEEPIDDGLGVFIKKKTLYHGSGTEGIAAFNKAEEDTVGSGVYFTAEAKDAIEYARIRATRIAPQGKERVPVIYEATIENLKLLDLRKDENIKRILPGFKELLIQMLKDPNLKWNVQRVLQNTISEINSGSVNSGSVRKAAWHFTESFSKYVQSLGYDGLTTFEGGEGKGFNHETFLIFDPEKAKIQQEHRIM